MHACWQALSTLFEKIHCFRGVKQALTEYFETKKRAEGMDVCQLI